MTRIGVCWNSGKPHGLASSKRLIELLGENGLVPVPDNTLAHALDREDGASISAMAQSCDAIIVLGGDGTLLAVAEPAARSNVPLLGVNIGHMGFMTEITPNRLREAVERLRDGKFEIEHRMMICADSVGMPTQTALNDITLYRKSDELHLVQLHVSVGGASMGNIKSDGLIISTPTGSTAYSLSAGGPVVDPMLDCMLITPICPHSPLSRPAVLPDWEKIELVSPPDGVELLLSADGLAPVTIMPGQKITITRSKMNVSFIRFERRSFYDAFRVKISEWSN